MFLLLFAPQSTTPTDGINISTLASDLLPRLGAVSFSDLTWCTQDELLQWADEAAKHLARVVGGFVEHADTGVTAGSSTAGTPLTWVSTIHISVDGKRLRAATVAELQALDAKWSKTAGLVERYSMDAGEQMSTITLYRIPQVNGTLAIIFHAFPATISTLQPLAPVASPVGDYFAYAMLASARGKQSEAALPEMAKHCRERMAMYEDILRGYFGEAS